MAGVREKLLTASDLASLCEVDLKTIHNWVDRGRIAHFRTPGRHLRFRAADVAEFLRAWGYTVPRELAKASSRSVLVIGTKDTLAHVAKALGEAAPIRHAAHPYDALVYAGSDPADVYIADPKAAAGEVDLDPMLEALHRACPQAVFIVLVDEGLGAGSVVPTFVSRVPRNDVQALRAALAPAGESAAPSAVPTPMSAANAPADEPRSVAAAGGSSR